MSKLFTPLMRVLAATAIGGCGPVVVAQTATLRFGEPVFAGEIVTGVSAAGVSLSSADGVRTVSLDRVAGISADPADPLTIEWGKLRQAAFTLWRARTRIERGDVASSEAMLETLIPAFGEAGGETGPVLWAGILRCRMLRGGVPSAIVPFTRYRGLRARPGPESSMFRPPSSLPDAAILDEAAMLCPGLPPIFVATPAVIAAARDRIDRAAPNTLSPAINTLYDAALIHEFAPISGHPFGAVSDDGTVLVRDIVKSRLGTFQERATARAALEDRLSTVQPGWVYAWCHTAVGRSLVMEEDVETRLLGVAQLLRVPASYAADVPYLTGLALAEAAVALHRLGDTTSAILLRTEVAETMPDHPVLDWPQLRAITTELKNAPAGAAAVPVEVPDTLLPEPALSAPSVPGDPR